MYFGNKVPRGKNNWEVEIYRHKLEKLTLIFKFSSNALWLLNLTGNFWLISCISHSYLCWNRIRFGRYFIITFVIIFGRNLVKPAMVKWSSAVHALLLPKVNNSFATHVTYECVLLTLFKYVLNTRVDKVEEKVPCFWTKAW